LNLEDNYLDNEFLKTNIKLYYHSALIYIEMAYIYVIDANILRLPGYYELAFVDT